MSISLNNEAIAALNRLKDNIDFQKLMSAFGDVVHVEMHKALDVAPEHVVMSQIRARALRDVWSAFTGGMIGKRDIHIDKQVIHRGKQPRSALPTQTFASGGETPGEDLIQ